MGNYKVGAHNKESKNGSQPINIFHFQNQENINIISNNSEIKFIDSLYFVLEADNNNIKFKNCHIVGTIINGNQTNNVNNSTKFINCKIDDNTNDFILFYNSSLVYNYSIAGKNYSEKSNFNISNNNANCLNFFNNTSYPIIQRNIFDTSYYMILKDCKFSSNDSKLFNADYYTTVIGGIFCRDNYF